MRPRGRAIEVRVAGGTSDQAVWREIQATCFEPVSVRLGKQTTRVPRIVAYHMNLIDQAARGDVGAAREQIGILRRLERHGILDRPQPDLAPTWFEKHLEDYRRIQAMAGFWNAVLSQLMVEDVRASYAAQGVPMSQLADTTLEGIDWESIGPRLDRFWKRVRRARRGQPYEVGYGKPPIETRFRGGESGNAAGRRARGDGYEGVRRSLLEPQIYQDASGKTIRTSKVAGACKQVFAKAIAGDPAARRVVAHYLAMLEELGMLVAPRQPDKPARRKRQSEADRATMRGFVAVLVPCVKRDLLRTYERRFGVIPPFETWLEKSVKMWELPEKIFGMDLTSLIRAVTPTRSDPNQSSADQSDDYAEDYEARIGQSPDDGDATGFADEVDEPELTSIPRPQRQAARSSRTPARTKRP